MKRQVGRFVINAAMVEPARRDWAEAIVASLHGDGPFNVVVRVDLESFRAKTVPDAALYLAATRAGLARGLDDPLADLGSELDEFLSNVLALETALLEAARAANKVLCTSIEFLVEYRNDGVVRHSLLSHVAFASPLSPTRPRRPRRTTRRPWRARPCARPNGTSASPSWQSSCARRRSTAGAASVRACSRKLANG